MMPYPLPMKRVIAAHTTSCQECGRLIKAGETYLQRIENSEIVRQCMDCRVSYRSLDV
jgi:RNase P subunit RPR2